MNSKKILVVVLLVITVIIGLIAVYLISTLTSTPQNIDDNFPTVTETTTPIVTTPEAEPIKCGQSCTNTNCEEGSTCLVVGGFRRCVEDVCLNEQGEPTQNEGCSSNYCTDDTLIPTATITVTPTPEPTNVSEIALDVSKRAIYQCSSTAENRIIQIELVIINESENAEQLSIIDDLTGAYPGSSIVAGSISNNGKVNGDTITWEKINITAEATLKLIYKVQLTEDDDGKTFTTQVSATNANDKRSTHTTSFSIQFLPCTDLESDQITVMIFGAILMIFGFIAFKMQWNQQIGNFFWNHGLEDTYSTARTGKEIVDDKLMTTKATISVFTEGLAKRIQFWKRRRTLSEQEKFEQEFISSDNDE